MQVEVIEDSFLPTAYELKDLFEAHWEEVYQRDGADIDLAFYDKMEAAGMFFMLYAYCEGIIIGYSSNFLAPNIHQRGRLTCSNDALYVDPLYRDTPAGLKLIRETEKKAKEHGADMMVWYAPLETALGKLLPRMKYKAMETVLIKDL